MMPCLDNFGVNIGTDDFREIRDNNLCYVDKTTFLEELLFYPNKCTLITRPRRFGKSLMMSMLDNFFSIKLDSKEIFSDLKISENQKLCSEWMNKYPVIFISFKEMNAKSFNLSLGNFLSIIQFAFLEYKKQIISSKNVDDFLKNKLLQIMEINYEDAYLFESTLRKSLLILINALYSLFNKKVILLIDEYDVPINTSEIYNYYEEMINFMREVFGGCLKGNKLLQLAVLTGCLRISKESIFTGVNNFACYGVADVEYADKFGFTNSEVDTLLAKTNFSAKKNLIKEWYDGYLFGNDTEVYCPWDVLYYLRALQKNSKALPQAYWINTSANDLLQKSLESQNATLLQTLQIVIDGRSIKAKINQNITFANLHFPDVHDIISLLYLTGYLTKCKSKNELDLNSSDLDDVDLIIPNKEILKIFNQSFFKTIKNIIQQQIFDKHDQKIDELIEALFSGVESRVGDILTNFLTSTISFFDYSESFYHAYLLGILSCKFNDVKSNREVGLGRSDIQVKPNNKTHGMIIEVKWVEEEKLLLKSAIEALDQIEKNKYDFDLRQNYSTIIYWGISFFKKQCLAKFKIS